MMSRLFENSLIAAVGAIVATITSAIIDRLLPTRINISYWWAWAIGGFLVTLLIVWAYRRYRLGVPSVPSVLMYGSRVAIRTSDDNYVFVDVDRDKKLFGRADTKTWTIFEIVHAHKPFMRTRNEPVHYNHPIAFRTVDKKLRGRDNKIYVAAVENQGNQLKIWSDRLQGWETFTLCSPEPAPDGHNEIVQYGDLFALRAHSNNYVSYIQSGHDGRLLAEAPSIRGAWETFVFIDPKRPK